MMSMMTQSGRLTGISRSASALERLTVTICPAFSRSGLAIRAFLLRRVPRVPMVGDARNQVKARPRAAAEALAPIPALPDHERHEEGAGARRPPHEPAALPA